MADLSATFTELRNAVSFHLGYGAACPAAHDTEVDALVKSGLRRVYTPPPINGQVHRWRFLEPVTTLSINGAYSTGTVDLTDASTTVEGTGVVFPSWIDTDTEIIVDGVAYPVASRTDDDTIELASAWSGTLLLETYSLIHRKYTLPEAFGHMIGSLVFEGSSVYDPIDTYGEQTIRELYQSGLTISRPYIASVRPKACDGSVVQRYELFVYPAPEAAYTLSYRYSVLPSMLVELTNEYPYGGAAHGELFLEACLMVADERLNDAPGIHHQQFNQLLAASIARDTAQTPDRLGVDGSGRLSRLQRRNANPRLYYNGTELT